MNWPHRLLSGQISDLDLRLLRMFRVIVECEGFAAAEGELGVTRSTISKRISDLELRVGARLCERGRSGFSVTNEGRIVYEATVELLAALDRFRSHVNEVHADAVAELHIGLIDTLVSCTASPLVDVLRAYGKANRNVRLNLMVGTSVDIQRAVHERRLHVGIVPEPDRPGTLAVKHLFKETSLLYCGRGHSLFDSAGNDRAKPDLTVHPLVRHGYSLAEAKAIDHWKLLVSASSQQTEGVLFLVLTGQYLGFLPDHYGNIWEQMGQIRRIMPNAIQKVTNIVAMTQNAPECSPIVRRFMSLL